MSVRNILAALMILFGMGRAGLCQQQPFDGLMTLGGGSCAQANTFLDRMTGESSLTKRALATAICHLVSAGLVTGNLSTTGCGAPFDVFYFWAVKTAADGVLNLCGTSYTAIPNGSPVFTACAGFTGVNFSSTVYLNSGFNASVAAGHFALNSAHLAVWALTTPQSSAAAGMIASGVGEVSLYPQWTDGNFYARANGLTAQGIVAPAAIAAGLYLADRPNATTTQGYEPGHGSGSGTAFSTSVASAALQNGNIWFLNANNATPPPYGCSCQLAFGSIGGSMTATQITSLYEILNTYMTTVVGSSC